MQTIKVPRELRDTMLCFGREEYPPMLAARVGIEEVYDDEVEAETIEAEEKTQTTQLKQFGKSLI